jgi:YrbI family 3-deoxy-D-manno-octulosonate 8-phosphate phosphatase
MKQKTKKKDWKLDVNKIELIVYDFDGVMTDNKVILREDGLESVVVSRSDGLAVEIIKKELRKQQVIISKEKNRVVEARAKKLGIPVISGVDKKKEILFGYCKRNNIRPENVVFIGNDLNDLKAMTAVGWPICPSDACEEVKNISKRVLDVRGGDGVVREFLNHIKQEV